MGELFVENMLILQHHFATWKQLIDIDINKFSEIYGRVRKHFRKYSTGNFGTHNPIVTVLQKYDNLMRIFGKTLKGFYFIYSFNSSIHINNSNIKTYDSSP